MSTKLNLEKLNNIGPGVDLAKVPQINKKRLLKFINHFIITTVAFLNKFAQSSESRLLEFDLKMQKLEAELCLLESKLNSIPGLEVEVKLPPTIETPSVSVDPVPTPTATHEINKPSIEDANQDAEAEPEASETPAERSPELAKYFKMLHLGVPAQAVKLKMKMEGFDPNLLDE